jgi:hypothetical protein
MIGESGLRSVVLAVETNTTRACHVSQSPVSFTPTSKLTSLPTSVRPLIAAFRVQLANIVGRNLVGAYLFGSIAFSGFDPRSGDIDFYVLIRRPLTVSQKRDLDRMHRALSDKFHYGERLDGFYITLIKARKRSTPRRLPFAANGKLHEGGRDNVWALHRQHLRQGACVVLHGPRPVTFLPSVSWNEITRALIAEFSYAKRIADKYPSYSVLNACRIVYTFKNKDGVVSKIQAAHWATSTMPHHWKPLIRSALRVYLKKPRRGDQKSLKNNSQAFLRFASSQMSAVDPASRCPQAPRGLLSSAYSSVRGNGAGTDVP